MYWENLNQRELCAAHASSQGRMPRMREHCGRNCAHAQRHKVSTNRIRESYDALSAHNEGAAQAEKKRELPDARKPPVPQSKAKNSNLPQTINRDSIKHSIILADSNRASDFNRRLRVPTALNQFRQILPDMPALPEEHGHNGDHITAVGDKLAHCREQIRLHQLKKS
jgi:hypothetical protein